MTPMAACVAAMLMLAAVAGCASAKKADAPRGGAETPIESSQLVRGALPGLQVVAVSKLTKADQQAIQSWTAADKPVGQTPALAAGTYAPDIDGHVLEAARGVGNDNGIATSVITLSFDPEGTKLLNDVTTAEAGRDIAIVIAGKVVVVSEVAEPLSAGQYVIEGSRELVDSIAKSIVPAP